MTGSEHSPQAGAAPLRPTRAEIDLAALRSNFAAIQALASPSEIACPMVKANAYGHGDVGCAAALRAAGAKWLGVALFEEGLRLRDAGDAGAILVFGWCDQRVLREALARSLTPVVGSLGQLREVARAATDASLKAPLAIHLEFNTGMNRLGLEVADAPEARALLDSAPSLALEGACTHLYGGEDAGFPGGGSERQIRDFERALGAFQGISFRRHALNSAGAAGLASAGPHPYGIRPGIALYGSRPASDAGAALPLRPVMALKSRVVQLRRLAIGEKVSYGGTWEAKRPSLIGVLPVGYADGYFRAFSNKGSALVRGRRAPVAGTVCMDYLMLDLTDIERQSGEIPLGEEAVLLGRQGNDAISADELAGLIGTISYEIFTSVSGRVPRVFIDDADRRASPGARPGALLGARSR
jgi:alanine racemase